MRYSQPSAVLIILPLVFISVIVVFGIVALLTDDTLAVGDVLLGRQLTVAPTGPPEPLVSVRPEMSADLVNLRNVGLGVSLDYPATWRKKETTLQVIFSPSADGLDPGRLQAAALWVGIPADSRADPPELLQAVVADFPATITGLSQGQLDIGTQRWLSARLDFESEAMAGPGIATVAATSKNEVGYYLVAVAPADRWAEIQPVYQAMLASFRFIAEAEIPPTPSGPPPPTPTATPTPVIYVVQSGDTLLGIALEYGVDVEALATRNGIDRPENLRTGERLVIPIRRR